MAVILIVFVFGINERNKVHENLADLLHSSIPPEHNVSSNPIDQIEKFANLRDRNIITEVEFEKKRAELLEKVK